MQYQGLQGLIERGAYLKNLGHDTKKSFSSSFTSLVLSKMTFRDAEDKKGRKKFDSRAYEIRNWPNFDEIHHELSLNPCTLHCTLSCMKGVIRESFHGSFTYRFMLLKFRNLEMEKNKHQKNED